jgi:hypothetical protein
MFSKKHTKTTAFEKLHFSKASICNQQKHYTFPFEKFQGRKGGNQLFNYLAVCNLCRLTRKGGERMDKFKWALKQMFPFSYCSEYKTSGHKEVAVWHMWMGRCFAVRRWRVA